MEQRDLVIIGAGPAGLRLASRLAEKGLVTLVLDDRRQVGLHKICTGIIGAESFSELDLPRGSVVNQIQDIRFVSPAGSKLDYRHPEVLALVVNRGEFDRDLGQLAIAQGAELRSGCRVTDVLRAGSGFEITYRSESSETPQTLKTRFLVLATGVNYRLNKSLGLGSPVSFLSAVQAHLQVRDCVDRTHCFAGRVLAPGAFAWMVPLQPGVARVGLMAEAPASSLWDGFLKRLQPYLADPMQPVSVDYKPIAQRFEGPSVGDSLLAVGEASGQVKTTTGGGIYYGLLSADLAGEIILQAFAQGRFDAGFLGSYEAEWKSRLGGEIDIGFAFRQAFSKLSDNQIEALFQLARTNGIIPLVRKTAHFDWHSGVLKAVGRYSIVPRILGFELPG